MMSTQPLRRNRYETLGEAETLSVELPHGIGTVHIRTGNVQGSTGNPVVAIEVVSDALDTPAADGRLYEPLHSQVRDTIYLIGYPDLHKEN